MKIAIGSIITTRNGEKFECMTMQQLELVINKHVIPYSDSRYWGYDKNDGVYLSWRYDGTPINNQPGYVIIEVKAKGE